MSNFFFYNSMPQFYHFESIYGKILFVVELKLKFHWASCILSGNPNLGEQCKAAGGVQPLDPVS